MLNTKAPVLGSLGMTLAREQGGCLSRRCIELSLAVYIIMERGEGNKTHKEVTKLTASGCLEGVSGRRN